MFCERRVIRIFALLFLQNQKTQLEVNMANNPGAKKRIRQNAVRRLRNRYRLSTTRTAIKNLKLTEDKAAAEKLLPGTISLVDRCVKSNIYHKNKAARIKGQLYKFVSGLN